MKAINLRKAIFAVALAAIVCSSCNHREDNTSESPVLMLRLSINNTKSDQAWADMLSILQRSPECCDEIWFSSGIGIPPMNIHEDNAARLMRAKEDLRKLGIASSIQIQMTIGHGDQLGISDEWSAKNWTGWTGSTGVEAKYCNCPRQTEYLEYMRQVARLYAKVKPRVLWVDDDLRYDNHYPATNNSRIGCWCETCLEAFSKQEGKAWSREELDKAMASDKELRYRWKLFSIESLVNVAHLIAEETKAVAPDVQMGYQKTFYEEDSLVVSSILKELATVSGRKVAYRPGGGAYYDKYHPANQIMKSMDAARFMHMLGPNEYVDIWCPEIESYPRHYGSRTPQGVLLEGFAALAYGSDAVSMYVVDKGQETLELKSRWMLAPLAEGTPMLRAYAAANKGTTAVGYRCATNNTALFEFGVLGIPVLPGEGESLGMLTSKELKGVNTYSEPSSAVQEFREAMQSKSPSPVLCQSPFLGLVMPRVDEESGVLRTLGVINCRIDTQSLVRFKIDSLPADIKSVVWYEMRHKPVRLKVERDESGAAYVEIPEIAAWNAGFLKF